MRERDESAPITHLGIRLPMWETTSPSVHPLARALGRSRDWAHNGVFGSKIMWYLNSSAQKENATLNRLFLHQVPCLNYLWHILKILCVLSNLFVPTMHHSHECYWPVCPLHLFYMFNHSQCIPHCKPCICECSLNRNPWVILC